MDEEDNIGDVEGGSMENVESLPPDQPRDGEACE